MGLLSLVAKYAPKSKHEPATAGRVSRSASGQNFLKILVDPSEANIDIIAIHGLNPLNKESHAEATWTSEDKLWLRYFLPRRVPHARICLFGYNSNVAFGSSAAGVREQSENLLNHLEQIRTALVHTKADATYKNIWESTIALVFFATPQQGGNHAGFGDIVASIGRCMTRNPGNTFMDALKSNSAVLSIITDDFRQMLEDFQIISFYETRPLGSFGLIVDQKSALLGLPGTRERQIPIDADHRGICKFSSMDDPRYKLVEDNIAQIVTSATSLASRRCSSKEEPHLYEDNTSSITGLANIVTQAGHRNQNIITGSENRAGQFGGGNSCEITGKSNTATQASLEFTAILLVILRLILDKWGFTKWQR
ncbi:hypothetical protein F5Y12DRAFT_721376 [Xylaria sp. FL1777]|nr:hypothetical protein F5Y12DRAFT_721376 [Xylaria sp. FL1777]